MNKKYIDFVPAKPKQPVKKAEPVTKKEKAKVSDVKKSSAKKVVKEVDELEIAEMFEARKEKSRAGVTISKKKKPTSGTFSVPKVRFVNTEKITKRPLSKNVYPKKVVIPKEVEKPSAPVTIIDKPEKDSKVGMIVAIIITIILGAAAGTVAFLLLPN